MKRAMLFVSLAGCFAYEKVPVERPAPELRKIGDAQMFSMRIDPRNQQPALCPGDEGKLYMTASVQWPNQTKPVDRNIGSAPDSLQPTAFDVESALVQTDAQAHLHPSADVLASVDGGFPMKIVYKPNPKYHFEKTFPPEYSCYHGTGDNGGGGNAGDFIGNGDGAQDLGQQGGRGKDGGVGYEGGRGGSVTAYVTMVKTRYYGKLIAVIANGQFHLAPPDRPITFSAVGGQGGQGGAGGQGGQGGDQRTESRTRYNKDTKSEETYTAGVGGAGKGGHGGNGGNGGHGGDGGAVDVTYDAQFPELAQLVLADARGGAGGPPGPAGGGGGGGGSSADENRVEGEGGDNGDDGRASGSDGRRGSASVRAGNVSGRFASLRGIQLLGRR